MNIFSFSVRRPVTVTVIVLALVIISLIFTPKLNIESFPKIDIPVITVTTIYKGAGPEEIEEQVTIPVEEAVGSVGNITRIDSISSEGMSMVMVEFEYGTNMDAAAADIREKLDKIKNRLPEDAENPIISKVDVADRPIIQLTLTDEKGNLRRLHSFAKNEIKKDLEKIAGVSSVEILGGEERAIEVKLDRSRLEAYSIPPNMVVSAIARENVDIPAGHITSKDLEFNVRSVGQFKSVRDFENIMIAHRGREPIYLKDVATVIDGKKEVRTITKSNGFPCVTISIKKNTDANTVKVADAVRKSLDDIRRKMPASFHLEMAYDGSTFVKSAINDLKENAIQGGMLAIIMVLIFLGSIKSTAVIGLSIPISIAVAFLLMYFNGMTINMITLVGFILAVGSIVDASIVVLENIFRHIEMGKDPFKASVDGASEVGGAVMGAVLTNVIVFIPMFLVKGFAGQIFSELAKAYIFALLCSLAVAVTVVPMLCSRFLAGEVERQQHPKGISGWYLKWWNKVFGVIRGTYYRMLKWSLEHRPVVIMVAIGIFVLTAALSTMLKTELAGKWDRGDFIIQIETPVGSSLSRTAKVVNKVEDYILQNIPERKNVISIVGKLPTVRRGASMAGQKSPYLGGFTVVLKDAAVRKKLGERNMYDVMDDITNRFKDYPGASIRVMESFSISGRKPIEILIKGNNFDTLTKIANNLKEKLKSVKGLKNLEISYRPGVPEYKIKVDRRKAAEVGLNAGVVYQTLRILMAEDRVSTYREEGNEYDIFVQLRKSDRDSIKKISTLKFVTPSGKQVALEEIAKVIPAYGPANITRRDRIRYVSVQANIISGYALSEVLNEIKPILNNLKLPHGYTWEIGGEEKERRKIFNQMFEVLFLAVILIYVFLAVQFESFIHPFTIMMSVPLELAGIFGALIITHQTMTMFALLGVIMLVGVVVSAAIVLIDYIIQRKEKGLSTYEAILEAAPLRLRPVLMTAGTTMIAMIPLALGLKAGSEMFQPLAIGSIGGLFTSTFLTLIIVPVVYSLFEDLQKKFSKKNS